MEMDFSWARSAVEYLQLYRDAMEKVGARKGIRIA
jgi:glycogen synthase